MAGVRYLLFCVLIGIAAAVHGAASDGRGTKPDKPKVDQPKGGNGKGADSPAVPVARPAHEWWVRRALFLPLTVVGPGEVRATIVGSTEPQLPGTVGCRFDGLERTATAMPEGGLAQLGYVGWFIPRRGGSETRTGDCRLLLDVSRRSLGGPWSAPERVEATPLVITPHARILISETVRMRAWLKPHLSAACRDDDADGKLGVRVNAGQAGGDCRADFLTARNRTGEDRNFNVLPEAVIVRAVTWRVEGDRAFCTLCADPTGIPCRGPAPPSVLVPYQEDLMGPAVREGTETQGLGGAREYAIFTGPPFTPRGAAVVEPNAGVTIGHNEQGIWRSYALSAASRIACDAWFPPPATLARSIDTAVQNAINRVINALIGAFLGTQPAPLTPMPAAPSMRLVLDSWEFLRPQATVLPFE